MKTLLEHIDDLDRMIDAGNTPPDKLRSQLAFIGREVSALQADYAGLNKYHSDFRESAEKTISQLDSKLAEKNARDKKLMDDWFQEQAHKQAEFRKSHTLNYDA